MSYQQKYLKYKSKYLALKTQAVDLTTNNSNVQNNLSNLSNLVQLGGGKLYNDNSGFEHLTATPSLTEIWGGSFSTKSKSDIANLVNLLSASENENIITTEFSLDGGSDPENTNTQTDSPKEEVTADSDNSDNLDNLANLANTTESKIKTDSDIKSNLDSDSDIKSNLDSDSDSSSESSSSSSSLAKLIDNESEVPTDNQVGGKKKPNSYKKFFFEDSDLVPSSTTSDSELSSFDTSSTGDSDANL